MSQSLLSSQSVDSMVMAGDFIKAMTNMGDRVLAAENAEGPGRPSIEICWGEMEGYKI